MNITHCPYCHNKQLYVLQNDYRKCKRCKKKFSMSKLIKDIEIIELFCSNKNSLETANRLKVNYRTISNRFLLFRKLIATYLENEYHKNKDENSSYEEYFYFTQRQKSNKSKSLYDAINIIGFYSNKKVFTLLMPELKKTFNEKKDKEYERYLYWHKLQSKNAYKTPINVFFGFLEQNLKKYKGINNENFFYYLKETEFKYNYLVHEQIENLKNLYFSHLK